MDKIPSYEIREKLANLVLAIDCPEIRNIALTGDLVDFNEGFVPISGYLLSADQRRMLIISNAYHDLKDAILTDLQSRNRKGMANFDDCVIELSAIVHDLILLATTPANAQIVAKELLDCCMVNGTINSFIPYNKAHAFISWRTIRLMLCMDEILSDAKQKKVVSE